MTEAEVITEVIEVPVEAPVEAKPKRKSPTAGKPLSEEHKRKISEAHKGQAIPEEQRKKISESMKGHKASDRQREVASAMGKEKFKKLNGKSFNPNGKPSRIQDKLDKMSDELAMQPQTARANAPVLSHGDGSGTQVLSAIKAAATIARTVDRNNPETLMSALFAIMGYCVENDIRMTNQLCYLACAVTKNDVDKWAAGIARASDPRYAEFAQMTKHICSAIREQLVVDGKVHPVVAIWWQKIYDGYRETTEVAAEGSTESKLTPAEIREKYKDMPR